MTINKGIMYVKPHWDCQNYFIEKNKELMEGRKNVVTVELNDDLRDKVSSLSTIIVGMKQTFLFSLTDWPSEEGRP